MNQTQMNAAMKSLTEWLSHPAELGKAPAKIECAGEFDHNKFVRKGRNNE